jgi:signal transduction histidine kinase
LTRLRALITKPRGVHGGITVALVVFGLIMMASLTFQNFSSQGLIEHPYWGDLLRSISADHAARVRAGEAGTLPQTGLVRSWYIAPGQTTTSAPPYLAELPPGFYSTENGFRNFTELESFHGKGSFHAAVVDLKPGRLITAVDINAIEDQQNRTSWWSVLWALSYTLMIVAVVSWLHANLVRPVRDLADRMQAIDPRDSRARLPTTYAREEIQLIAQASNLHLERVGQFIERERSLLDQASHEFRTPIAVIAGAVDVLKQMPLPDTSQPALARIEHAVEGLSETMVALLYLAREPEAGSEPAEVTALHECLPRIVEDHEHLLSGRVAQLRVGTLPPTYLAAPEAMVRIAVSNLIRNAIEHTEAGYVEVTLSNGVIAVVDSGSGFNPVEAARRYRDSLRRAAPTRGQGLGLFLIGRICERFGWRLEIDAGTVAGTRAHLDVSASVIPL